MSLMVKQIILAVLITFLFTSTVAYLLYLTHFTTKNKGTKNAQASQVQAAPEQPQTQLQQPPQQDKDEIVGWDTEVHGILEGDEQGNKREIIYGMKKSPHGNLVIWKLGDIVK